MLSLIPFLPSLRASRASWAANQLLAEESWHSNLIVVDYEGRVHQKKVKEAPSIRSLSMMKANGATSKKVKVNAAACSFTRLQVLLSSPVDLFEIASWGRVRKSIPCDSVLDELHRMLRTVSHVIFIFELIASSGPSQSRVFGGVHKMFQNSLKTRFPRLDLLDQNGLQAVYQQ